MSVVTDAWIKGRKVIDGLIIPKHRDKSEESLTKGDLWRSTIAQSDLKKAYERNGITRKLVNKVASDIFDNWFEVKSDNQQLIDDVKSLFSSKKGWPQDDEKKHLGLKKTLKQADQVGIVEGYAILALGFKDDAELSEEVSNPTSLDYVSLLTPSDVKKINLDDDINSDTYGEIISAKIKIGTNDAKEIHASRFIHIPVNVYGNSIHGIGFVKPAYNYLTVLENVIWSVGQSFYRYASGFPHLKKKGGKPDQIKKIMKQWKNVNSLTGWVSDDDTEIIFAGAKAVALDPEKYFKVAIQAVAMSFDIPEQIVLGVAAGAVTGSETNLMDYYSDISSKQEIDWTPIIEQLIRIAQKTKQVAEGEFEINWNPLFETKEKERAEIEKIKAETIKLQIEAGVADPKEIKKELERKKTQADIAIVKKKLIDAELKLLPLEYDSRTNLKGEEVEKLMENYSNELQKLFSVEEIMKAARRGEVAEILTDDFTEFLQELELIKKAKERKVKEIVDRNVEASWGYGTSSVEGILSMSIVASERAKQIRKIIKQTNYTFANSYGQDVTKKTLYEVQQSMLAGESYAQMRKKIKPIIDGAKHSAIKIARTETMRTLSEAIKQSYRDSGVVKKVQWLTAGDESVCPECASLDGKVFDIDATPAQPMHPMCRCTLIAYFEK